MILIYNKTLVVFYANQLVNCIGFLAETITWNGVNEGKRRKKIKEEIYNVECNDKHKKTLIIY
jgi:hypothetical protein